MVDFRYFVATIVAMFLMLGIGILVGSASNFGPAVLKQETTTIQSLNGKLDDVLKESARDHTLLRQNEDALAALAPRIVAGKLTGRRVAIVRTGDYGDAAQAASTAILAAGGTVASSTTLTGRLQLLDEHQRGSIMRDLGIAGDPASDGALGLIVHPLAAVFRVGTLNRSDLASALATLDQDGVIDRSGDYTLPVSAVVVVGGELDENADESAQIALVDALTDSSSSPSLSVAGCEPYDVANSSMPSFSRSRIAGVDCIDLPVGAIDLPFALRGGEPAIYGVKTDATRLLPNVLSGLDAQPSAGAARS